MNTIPIENFINKIKAADRTNAKEVKIPLNEAKDVMFSLTTLLARLQKSNQIDQEPIIVKIGDKPGW